jgi:hypothetical protein
MRECSTLTDLAQAEIDALQADGIALTPAEIVKVNWLATQVETPEHRMLYARGCPAFVGGVVLWPLTTRAANWYRRVALRSMPASLYRPALAYAMAFGRSEGLELDQPSHTAQGAITAWHDRLTCTRAELDQAMAQILSQSEIDEQPPPLPGADKLDGDMTPGDMSAFLCASAGGSPDMWERQVSCSYVLAMFQTIIQQNKADNRPSQGDPRITATRALGWYCHKIRKARKVAVNG